MKLIKLENLIYLFPLAIISGPFLADLLCSFSALIFLIHVIYKRKYYYLNNNFIKLFFLWIIILLISSLNSEYIFLSLESSLFYFRFLLFALFISLLIEYNFFTLNKILIGLRISLIFLIIDGYFQYIFNFNLLGFYNQINTSRLSGIYRDEYVLGSIIIRLLPIYFALELFYNYKKLNLYYIFIFISYLPLVFLTGERSAFILGLIILFFSLFYLIKKIRLSLLIFFFIFIIITISSLIYFDKDIKNRIVDLTLQQVTDPVSGNYFIPKEYQNFIITSYKMFNDKPLLGHGPKSYRKTCKEDKYNIIENHSSGDDNCSTHPHNNYIQLLSETGILGTVPVLIFFFYVSYNMIISSIKLLIKKIEPIFLLEYFIFLSIFITLWPFLPTGNFFNNWLNVIYYLPIGILIYLKKMNVK